MSKVALFLDDKRPVPSPVWRLSTGFDHFRETVTSLHLAGHEIVAVAFDHDLDDIHYGISFERWSDAPEIEGIPETGYDAAKWFCSFIQENDLKFPKVFVHSANPAGALNILFYVNNFCRANGYPAEAERATTNRLATLQIHESTT